MLNVIIVIIISLLETYLAKVLNILLFFKHLLMVRFIIRIQRILFDENFDFSLVMIIRAIKIE